MAAENTMQSDCIVIIPTYNEKENIENIIRAVISRPEHPFNILVIDDGSPDGTADIVKGLVQEEFHDRLFLVERSGKPLLSVAVSSDWVLLILLVSSGRWSTVMSTSSRWMPISVMLPLICRVCWLLAKMRAMICPSARATFRA